MVHSRWKASYGRRTLTAEAIVVAGGGVVVADGGRGVEEEGAEVVDAAAHAEAVGPTIVAFAAAGAIVGDLRSADGHGAGRRDVDAAAEAVTIVAAVVAVA